MTETEDDSAAIETAENAENTPQTAASAGGTTETGAGAGAITLKYRLTGEVQGVGFRHYLAVAAEELSVRGWAKNESDGSLIVLLCGEESAISQMLPHLQQGPVGAAVRNMTELLVEDEDAPLPADFQTR